MQGQVGYWGSRETGGLVVGFNKEMTDWLDGQATGRRIFVSVSKERQVIIIPDATGGHVGDCTASANKSPYRYVSSYTPDSLFLDIDLPPFELHDVDFKVEEGCITAGLAEDYALPWPKLRLDCLTYEAEAMAAEALQWRLNSLFASGFTNFLKHEHRMPQRLHRLLPPGKYAECLATARALSEGSRL